MAGNQPVGQNIRCLLFCPSPSIGPGHAVSPPQSSGAIPTQFNFDHASKTLVRCHKTTNIRVPRIIAHSRNAGMFSKEVCLYHPVRAW
jgi:hypothetical protein